MRKAYIEWRLVDTCMLCQKLHFIHRELTRVNSICALPSSTVWGQKVQEDLGVASCRNTVPKASVYAIFMRSRRLAISKEVSMLVKFNVFRLDSDTNVISISEILPAATVGDSG